MLINVVPYVHNASCKSSESTLSVNSSVSIQPPSNSGSGHRANPFWHRANPIHAASVSGSGHRANPFWHRANPIHAASVVMLRLVDRAPLCVDDLNQLIEMHGSVDELTLQHCGSTMLVRFCVPAAAAAAASNLDGIMFDKSNIVASVLLTPSTYTDVLREKDERKQTQMKEELRRRLAGNPAIDTADSKDSSDDARLPKLLLRRLNTATPLHSKTLATLLRDFPFRRISRIDHCSVLVDVVAEHNLQRAAACLHGLEWDGDHCSVLVDVVAEHNLQRAAACLHGLEWDGVKLFVAISFVAVGYSSLLHDLDVYDDKPNLQQLQQLQPSLQQGKEKELPRDDKHDWNTTPTGECYGEQSTTSADC